MIEYSRSRRRYHNYTVLLRDDQNNLDKASLNSLEVDRMPHSHNFVSKSISTRCLGRVILTDTGISRAMSTDRNSEIVVIDDDMVYASKKGILRPT
jgi:hypothetical protein